MRFEMAALRLQPLVLATKELKSLSPIIPENNCCRPSDYTCGVQPLGYAQDAGTEWSDESCALNHGPVTGIRMWTTASLIKQWVT